MIRALVVGPGQTVSGSVSSDEENDRRHDSELSSHSKGTNKETEGRRADSDVAGQDAPDNQTEPIAISPLGASAAGFQSPRNPNSPVSSEFRQAFSPHPASVEPPVCTRAETSPTPEIQEGGASENQTLTEIRASLAKRKADKVLGANLSPTPEDKGDETVPAQEPIPADSCTKPHRTKRKRIASKTLKEPYHCSTSTRVLVGHRRPPQEADAEFQAIEDHFNAQLSRVKDLSGSLTVGEKQLSHTGTLATLL